MAECPSLNYAEPRKVLSLVYETENVTIGFVWEMISARTEVMVCLVCFSFPGSIIKKLLRSWRLLLTLRETCDKERRNQL